VAEGYHSIRQIWAVRYTRRTLIIHYKKIDHPTKPADHIRDSRLLHYLLGISTKAELETHPKLGSSWEGYALEEVIKRWCPTRLTSGPPNHTYILDIISQENDKATKQENYALHL